MAGENEVLEFLEVLIKAGDLFKNIKGREEIERLADIHASDSFLPNFNLDYLLRIQSVRSARAVLDALVDVEVVSTACRSISSDRKGRLYPDVAGC